MEKALGALPVVAAFSRRLDVAGTIDRLCPVRDVAVATHGQVITALIANRLTSPAPLVHVEDWGRAFAVPEVFGIAAEALNDDRVGRALDAIAPHLDEIVGSVGARAIVEFGIDVSRLHWDMTSISLVGDYDSPEAGFIAPSYGKPKDRRVDRKQVQTGLAVTGDGGIPVFHRAYDGKAGEISQVVGAMEALKAMAGQRSFLLVGDSKLVSYANLSAIAAAAVTFVAPASKSYVGADVLAGCDKARAMPVAYVPERHTSRTTPADPPTYLAYEDTMAIAGPRKADAALQLRRVFVWSSGNAQAAVTNRARKCARAADDLDRVTNGLGGRHYNTTDKVAAKVAAIARDRRVGDYLRFEIGTDANGRPTLVWHFDRAAVDAEAATDGWYALLTNLGPDEADAGEVLVRYKGQEVVERRYGDFKGPLAVAPMMLKNNRRIQALITVICLALLVFCLVERAVRLAISPATTMIGLYPERRAVKPTGRLVFAALSGMRLIPATPTSHALIPRPSPVQLHLMELLGVDPLALG
ncbi:MAG: IS1634 family transposase [Acidimicrobiales bacterium]